MACCCKPGGRWTSLNPKKLKELNHADCSERTFYCDLKELVKDGNINETFQLNLQKLPITNKASASCLGRCDLPKHKCLDKEDVKPGPVPKHMGWLYTAKNAPEHQLRCGWRPGHISCQVLRKIEQHNCMKTGECAPCPSACLRPPCSKPCCLPPKCIAICPSSSSCCKPAPPCGQPLIRIIRHGGQYTICTKPSNVSNAPSGPYPLKYVLNTDTNDEPSSNVKYSVEAKFNDYHFDYTSSQSSFVLDFSPPEQRCYKPCPKKSIMCMVCSVENNWPGSKMKKLEKKLSKSANESNKPNQRSSKTCCKPNQVKSKSSIKRLA